MPFFTYHCGIWLRQDAYDHPTEQANFLAEYGYELVAPPATYEELYDHAAFFTRKRGELLKGEPLEWDLYGEAIMGRVEINDETSGEIWGRGGRWVNIERDEQGNATGFVVTKANRDVIAESLASLKMQMDNWCSPGCLTAWWDFTIPEFIKGRHIIMPHTYLDFFFWTEAIYDEVPGAEVGNYPGIGGHAYAGNFYQGVPAATKNPEATYWLMRYIASEECQRAMIEGGVAGTRMDVMQDPQYQTGDWVRVVGQQSAVLNECFTTTETAEQMDDYIWFNSSAGGKIYEMTIILCHDAMTGRRTPDDAADEIVKQIIDLQTKYGELPIRSEL